MNAPVRVDLAAPAYFHEDTLITAGGFRNIAYFGSFKPSVQALRGVATAGAIRLADIVVALLALIALAPLMLVTALAILISQPGPVLFSQWRVGRHGQPFRCYKFRTMATNAQELLRDLLENDPVARAEWAADQKLRHDPRITPIGRFLRKSSIDELPQLFNVVKGEMSIVGPRPIVLDEIRRYGRYFDHYCRVRPGITGLWQVSGRNDTTYRRRVACDVAYVKSRSFLGNIQIIAATVPSVLQRSGSY